jgi:hypothetical protein
MRKSARWTIEQRFPSRAARDKEDDAIDSLPEGAPMSEHIDTWLVTYRAAGGVERR